MKTKTQRTNEANNNEEKKTYELATDLPKK